LDHVEGVRWTGRIKEVVVVVVVVEVDIDAYKYI